VADGLFTDNGMVLDKVKELGVVNPVCQDLAVYVPDRPGEDVQLTDSPVGFILFSRLSGESHVGDVSETRIKQQSQ
jgi:hypothetical protein